MRTPEMLRPLALVVALFLLVSAPAGAAGAGGAGGGGNATSEPCPLDLGYVRTFP